jgi:D-arginine dehydrogenase
LRVVIEADYIVIGAGIAGAGVACELAAHSRVVILERESQPGYHSTGRSAALFSEIYGGDVVRGLSRASRPFLLHPPEDIGGALLRPRGALFIASEEQRDQIDAMLASPTVTSHVEGMASAEAIRRVPILRPECAVHVLLEPFAHDIDVHALHQGFLRVARRQGATLFNDAEVVAIERDADRWQVSTGDETFRAPCIINAAGAWADGIAMLAGVAPLGIEPRRRTAILVDAPQGIDITPWHMVIAIDETFYFKPDVGRILISPADETPTPPCDAQPDELDIAIAVDRFEQATTMRVTQIRHRWAGLRSFVADRSPVCGYDPQAPGFFWLAAQGGYGIQTAPALSRAAAALAQGHELPSDIVDNGVTERSLAPRRA